MTVDEQTRELIYERMYWRWMHWHYRLQETHVELSDVPLPGVADRIEVGPLTIERLIKGSRTTTRAGVEWNGATLAPDFRQVIRGTLHHDMIYMYRREIAEALGVSVRAVRRWADDVFDEINAREGLWPPIRRAYYRAVRWLGVFFNR